METYAACRYGTLQSPPDTYIGAALEHYGEYGQLEADLLRSFLKSGSVVVEAGAHVGTLTVAMADAGANLLMERFESRRGVAEQRKEPVPGWWEWRRRGR